MTYTATVEVLSAEVRVLMVGSRQVTLSVYRQLDHVEPSAIRPMGRVCDPRDSTIESVDVVGIGPRGDLVRSSMKWSGLQAATLNLTFWDNRAQNLEFGRTVDRPTELAKARKTLAERQSEFQAAGTWRDLPLIILAGLT